MIHAVWGNQDGIKIFGKEKVTSRCHTEQPGQRFTHSPNRL